MYQKSKSRYGLIHLYNPKKEGLGPYDVNYMNAQRKNKNFKKKLYIHNNQRNVA